MVDEFCPLKHLCNSLQLFLYHKLLTIEKNCKDVSRDKTHQPFYAYFIKMGEKCKRSEITKNSNWFNFLFIISPIVSRARQRLEQPAKESSKGLFSFLSSTLIWRSKTKEKSNKNMFLDPRMHHNYDCCSATATTDHCVAHQFSDSGRIANRYDNSRWDVW